jgi:hypothetical protein
MLNCFPTFLPILSSSFILFIYSSVLLSAKYYLTPTPLSLSFPPSLPLFPLYFPLSLTHSLSPHLYHSLTLPLPSFSLTLSPPITDQGIKFCSKIQSAQNHFKPDESVGLVILNPTQLVLSQTDFRRKRYSDFFIKSNKQKN